MSNMFWCISPSCILFCKFMWLSPQMVEEQNRASLLNLRQTKQVLRLGCTLPPTVVLCSICFCWKWATPQKICCLIRLSCFIQTFGLAPSTLSWRPFLAPAFSLMLWLDALEIQTCPITDVLQMNLSPSLNVSIIKNYAYRFICIYIYNIL